VERNFVENAIIPTTWREGGFQVVGELGSGLTLQGGITTGFNLNKWDATSTEGQESPLGSIHQELALASARDLSVFGGRELSRRARIAGRQLGLHRGCDAWCARGDEVARHAMGPARALGHRARGLCGAVCARHDQQHRSV